jgi:hypothetical protein
MDLNIINSKRQNDVSPEEEMKASQQWRKKVQAHKNNINPG